MRRRPLRTAAVAVVALVGTLLVAGPAGAAPAKKWGTTFCRAVSTWGTGVSTISAAERAKPQAASAPEAAARLGAYLDTYSALTVTFGEAVTAAGTPDVANGARIEKTIRKGITAMVTEIDAIATALDALDVTDPTAFRTGAAQLQTRVGASNEPFSAALDRVSTLDRSGDLDRVLRTAPACKGLTGG